MPSEFERERDVAPRSVIEAPDDWLGAEEVAFRTDALAADRRAVLAVMLVALVYPLVLFLYQLTLSGAAVSNALVRTGNLLFVGVSAVGLLAMARAPTPAQIGRVATLWHLAASVLLAFILAVGPGRLTHPATVLFVVALQVMLPIHFYLRVSGAILVVVAAIANGVSALVREAAYGSLMVAETTVLLLALAVGAFYSVQFRRAQRFRFLEERRALAARRRALELGRLLPVCAWCSKVREDEAFWVGAREYLARRGILRTEHALCQKCSDAGRAAPEPEPEEDARDRGSTRVGPDDAETGSGARAHHAAVERLGLQTFFGALLAFALVMCVLLVAEGGSGVSGSVLLPRVLLVLALAGALLASARAASDQGRDLLGGIGAVGICIVGLALFAQSLVATPISMAVLITLMVYLLLPIPLVLRVLVGGALLGGIWLQTQLFVDALGGAFSVNVFIALLFANGVGAWAAREDLRVRAARWNAHGERLAEAERGDELEGLLPMCGACGAVRGEDGYWRDVFDYLSRHSAYSASHGICPDCLVAQE